MRLKVLFQPDESLAFVTKSETNTSQVISARNCMKTPNLYSVGKFHAAKQLVPTRFGVQAVKRGIYLDKDDQFIAFLNCTEQQLEGFIFII